MRHLQFERVLVTGPHRAGTTIASEIFAEAFGLPAVRESELATPRFDGDDEPSLTKGQVLAFDRGVLQGATTFRWLPDIADHFDLVIVVQRDVGDILKSQIRYRKKQIDNPRGKYEKLRRMNLPFVMWVSYEEVLSKHPMFIKNRDGWQPRQTKAC